MALFRVLGPLRVGPDARNGQLSRPSERALLGGLLFHANRFVSKTRLAEFIWTIPPSSADANIRTYAAFLRRSLDDVAPGLSERLETRRGAGGAYRLGVGDDELDAAVFGAVADEGRARLAAGDPRGAVTRLRRALSIWTGPAGEDLPDTAPVRAFTTDLEDRRTRAREDLAEALVALGDPAAAVADLQLLASGNPLRERPVQLLMHALYVDGEAAEAVAAYHRHRRTLRDETGCDPSPRLQASYVRMLRHTPT
ncbi:AfsR/SARP family transcriptional regulator [Asanoa sp. WMMD1127]|uniref:AfsR/SARP family transcriptional regulator n=1 Tax=Asanoa sp. WMMD1127 TaxID=3016107 RepID=UPI002417F435|nr:AfsR/SARP family transcriptional regulator [Asanoa sp. WMMD1127]MDG4823979.1 AfsR/SARP family transcriptional regulator [Asanoa sp. WMMD1127]